MEKGTVVEYDHPYKLLVNSIGDSDITNRNGHFASMVLKSGQTVARKIFEIA